MLCDVTQRPNGNATESRPWRPSEGARFEAPHRSAAREKRGILNESNFNFNFIFVSWAVWAVWAVSLIAIHTRHHPLGQA